MKERLILAALLACGIPGLCPAAAQSHKRIAANRAEFAADGATVVVGIQSNIYTYQVRNLSHRPVVGFQVPQHAAYNFKAPEGWRIETSDGLFRARTDSATTAIAPGQTAEFSMRVSSRGAVLGRAPLNIDFASGRTIELQDVWTPAPEPPAYLALVAGIILLIALLHSAIIIRRNRPDKAS